MANIVVVGAMIISSYSAYLNPYQFTNWSYFGMLLPAFLIGTLAFIPVWIFWKRKNLTVSIIGIIICWNSIRNYCPINLLRGEADSTSLKVLSYNVYTFNNYNENENRTEIADYIIESDADIVCLQEAGGIRKQNLYNSLNKKYPYIQIGNEAHNDCVLLSKHPIINHQQINLDTPSSSCYVDDVLINDDTIKVINCHLESYNLNDEDKQTYKQIIKNSNPLHEEQIGEMTDLHDSSWSLEEKLAKANAARARQAEIIQTELQNYNNKYIIMCGDSNDSPISYSHHVSTKTLKDAYTESGNGPGLSYNQNGMYFRIDHILISESFSSYKAKVDKYGQESDHYPIFCSLEMQ